MQYEHMPIVFLCEGIATVFALVSIFSAIYIKMRFKQRKLHILQWILFVITVFSFQSYSSYLLITLGSYPSIFSIGLTVVLLAISGWLSISQ